MLYSPHVNHLSVTPTNGIGPTKGQMKTLTSGLFLKSLETFRAYFGCHDSLYIFATPRFKATKLCNPLSFLLKDQLFKISRLQFDNWLLGDEKFSGLWRNRPQVGN